MTVVYDVIDTSDVVFLAILVVVILAAALIAAAQWMKARDELLLATGYLDGYMHGHQDGRDGKIAGVSGREDPRDVTLSFRREIRWRSHRADASWPNLR